MIRVLISTGWSALFAVTGLVLGFIAYRHVSPMGGSARQHGLALMVGLLLGLAAFSALREAEILPGLGRRMPDGAVAKIPLGRRVAAFFTGLGWTVSLAVIGAAIGYAVGHYGLDLPTQAVGAMAAAGMLAGALATIPLYWLGWLAGLGKARGQWGVAQAILLLVGFAGMQAVGQLICLGAASVVNRVSHGSFSLAQPEFGTAMALALAAGYLAAAWWSVWYIGRLGHAKLTDGGVSGIAWRPAPRRAYAVAAGFLVALVAMEAIVSHLAPPHGDEMIQDIFGTHGWKVVVLFVMAVGFAPAVEELVFRGGIFSALAGKCGTITAAVITSLLFTLAHLQEYYQYWPGLIVIGLVAAALIGLRLQYNSIRPGILLHVLFNAVGVLGMTFSH